MLHTILNVEHGREIVEQTDIQLDALSGLVDRGIISGPDLEKIVSESNGAMGRIEDAITRIGVPKHEVLVCLSRHYGVQFVEFNANLTVPGIINRKSNIGDKKPLLSVSDMSVLYSF